MRSERGFALIAALWLLVAIATVALEFSLSARARRLAAVNALDGSRAMGAAEAGLEHARARLERALRGDPVARFGVAVVGATDPWDRPGTLLADTVRLGTTWYHVTLRDVGAKLNINRAEQDEIQRFFAALRLDAGTADRLAQAIMDWRDPDDLTRPRGAEADDYLRAGSPVLPRNGPFRDLHELRFVQGMTDAVHARALPHLTLLGTGHINLNSADREVLEALPGMSDEAYVVLDRFNRRGQPLRTLQELRDELSPLGRRTLEANLATLLDRTTFQVRAIEAISDGWTEGFLGRARVEALFVRRGDAASLEWRSGS